MHVSWIRLEVDSCPIASGRNPNCSKRGYVGDIRMRIQNCNA